MSNYYSDFYCKDCQNHEKTSHWKDDICRVDGFKCLKRRRQSPNMPDCKDYSERVKNA